jgi:hypothetical protein
VIIAQPASQTATNWQDTSLSVGATGTAPLRHQWQLSEINLPGETNATLLLPTIRTNQAGGYRVIVTNALNAATNAVAQVTVVPPANAVYWDGGGDGTNWSDANNWSNNTLPGGGTDVIIEVAPSVAIVMPLANTGVRSIQCSGHLRLSGGRLDVTGGTSHLTGPFSHSGSILGINGASTCLIVTGPIWTWAASFSVIGRLSMPTLTDLSGYGVEARGGLIHLPAVTTIRQGYPEPYLALGIVAMRRCLRPRRLRTRPCA